MERLRTKQMELKTTHKDRPQMILLFQLRMISSKRLLRFVSRMNEEEFSVIKTEVESMVSSIKTIPSD